MNNNELSEFIKIAYERGKVRDVDNAFLEYPVEEEWHQGKIEYVLKEESTDYNIYSIGDIVFVNKYNYSNGNMGKNHFFLL